MLCFRHLELTFICFFKYKLRKVFVSQRSVALVESIKIQNIRHLIG